MFFWDGGKTNKTPPNYSVFAWWCSWPDLTTTVCISNAAFAIIKHFFFQFEIETSSKIPFALCHGNHYS